MTSVQFPQSNRARPYAEWAASLLARVTDADVCDDDACLHGFMMPRAELLDFLTYAAHSAGPDPARGDNLAANLASLNELAAEIVQALADRGYTDQPYAETTRDVLRSHSHQLGYTFQGEASHADYQH